MSKLKLYLDKVKFFLSQFQKKEKKKGNPKPKQVSKRTVNIAVLSGLCFIFGVSFLSTFRSITLYSKVDGLQKLVTQVKNTKNKAPTQSQTVDKNLEVYLGNYVKAYFTWDADAEKQSQQLDYLNTFYNAVPDVKAQGQTKNPTQLKYYQLLKIEDNQATFGVGYEETIKKMAKTSPSTTILVLMCLMDLMGISIIFQGSLGSQRLKTTKQGNNLSRLKRTSLTPIILVLKKQRN